MATPPQKKQVNVAALVRAAGTSEFEFLTHIAELLNEGDVAQAEEAFSRLNIPRAFPEEAAAGADVATVAIVVRDLTTEFALSASMDKFFERHVRKLKWHVSHPELENVSGAVQLYGLMTAMAEYKVRRVVAAMDVGPDLSVQDWGAVRDLLNRSYRDFRMMNVHMAGEWLDALVAAFDRETVRARLASFPALVAERTARLTSLRDKVEARRLQLTVHPGQAFRPVSPPRYFGGDLLDEGSWRHFWGDVQNLSDTARQHISL